MEAPINTDPPTSPTSSIAAFLNALWLIRPQQTNPDFDAGINTSSAWTESLSTPEGATHTSVTLNVNSLSDDEPESDTDPSDDNADLPAIKGRQARALFAFEGKPEFRELTYVVAGDQLEVLKEEVGDGWSLIKHLEPKADKGKQRRPEVGLLPQSYYTFTSEFAQPAELRLPQGSHLRARSRREASASSITPRGSPSHQPQDLPLLPQTTGEWFPSFRRSLLGGKSLNRFSSFVTSGAEEWVLNGTSDDDDIVSKHNRDMSTASLNDGNRFDFGLGEADRHFVDVGPSWKTKVPPFHILVHSPSKRSSLLSGAYTIYSVTSLFDVPSSHLRSPSSSPHPNTVQLSKSDGENEESSSSPSPPPVRITVHRRFSHFVVLHTALTRRLPGIALPPLPEKQYAGRFNDDFVEARRGDLERYLSRVVRHPVARYAGVLTFFLGCESDSEWKKQYPAFLSLPPAGPAFYANVYHPAFNLDADEATDTVDRFVAHTRAVGKGVQGLRSIFSNVRQASVEMSRAQRLLSYSLLSLITSQPLAAAPTTGISEEDEDEEGSTAHNKTKGQMNEQGAWCWKEDCDDCLKLTKAMQKTTEVLQSIADLYDDHASRPQLAIHEALKGVAHPTALYAGVVDTHRSTLSRFNEATCQGAENEEIAARCETVLNTTMAEIETYHTLKVEDFQTLSKDILDGEIALHEQILLRLKAARRTFDNPQYTQLSQSPRQPSIFERELEHPRLHPPPLTQPCPHVFDSAPMRPVSVAIQEGMGMLLGTSQTRGSVFGKFW